MFLICSRRYLGEDLGNDDEDHVSFPGRRLLALTLAACDAGRREQRRRRRRRGAGARARARRAR